MCRICAYKWGTSVASHINRGTGCPSCAGVVKWTLERFLERALSTHGDKFDYTLIKPDHIQGAHSYVPLKCNSCGHLWNQAITHHITSRNGCPECYGTTPWTLDKFLTRAKEVHGDNYNHDNITANMIQNQKSKIPVICNNCGHEWEPSITNHINNKTGCPECYGNIPWTLDRFIKRATEIHGDKYDYSQVSNHQIQGKTSKVSIVCKSCHYLWSPSIDKHINQKTGCPKCRKSHGELACAKYLDSQNIKYVSEFTLETLPRKRFNNRKYLLEFDGSQHFQFSPYYHDTEEIFKEKQEIDIIKTRKALESGYSIIRIDYTQIENVHTHIETAINSNESMYMSNPIMYAYITKFLK